MQSYEQASNEFKYPLHLGITESGTAFSGIISALKEEIIKMISDK